MKSAKELWSISKTLDAGETAKACLSIPQISEQKTHHKTMPSLKKLITKELRQEIVSYLFPFHPLN